MALKQHSSLKLGVRPSFCFISSNSSSVNRSSFAVVAVISIINFRDCESTNHLPFTDKYCGLLFWLSSRDIKKCIFYNLLYNLKFEKIFRRLVDLSVFYM